MPSSFTLSHTCSRQSGPHALVTSSHPSQDLLVGGVSWFPKQDSTASCKQALVLSKILCIFSSVLPWQASFLIPTPPYPTLPRQGRQGSLCPMSCGLSHHNAPPQPPLQVRNAPPLSALSCSVLPQLGPSGPSSEALFLMGQVCSVYLPRCDVHVVCGLTANLTGE